MDIGVDCPKCLTRTVAIHTEGHETPTTGPVSFTCKCGTVYTNEDLRILPPTQEEYESLAFENEHEGGWPNA